MKEFVSVKVSSFDHAALATTLTSKSADGWDVVSVVAVGNDIVAYLSRETTRHASTPASGSSPAATITSSATEPSGWAAASAAETAASAPTQVVAATTSTNTTSSGSPTDAANSTSASATTPSVPADWYKDPSGRYEYRYWDGHKWTEHVSRAGTVHKDPPTP